MKSWEVPTTTTPSSTKPSPAKPPPTPADMPPGSSVTVSVTAGRTVSLGNYEFIRADVTVGLTTTPEQYEDAVVWARAESAAQLETQVQSLLAQR